MKQPSEEELGSNPVRDPIKEAAAIADAVIENFRGLVAVEKAKFEVKLRHLVWRILTATYLAILSLLALAGFVFMFIRGGVLVLSDLGLSAALASIIVGGLPLIIISLAILLVQRSDKAKSFEEKLDCLRRQNVLRDQGD
jgi:hypothetical protein